MEFTLSYDKILRIIDCGNIIFFEDDFSFDNKKESLLYGYSRMNTEHRNKMLSSLSQSYEELAQKLITYSELFDLCLPYIDWTNKVIYGDISTAFSHIETTEECSQYARKLKEIYQEIEIPDEQDLLGMFHFYGLGVIIPGYFKRLFNEYIFSESMWKNYKIYKDFSAAICELFKKDLQEAKSINKTIVCIIDNQLSSGEQRANEILAYIKEFNNETRNKIIGAILSSKQRKEEFTDKFFAEFVDKKDTENLQPNLQNALVKSAYSLVLSHLKKTYLSTLTEAFDEAIANKDIASYLSKMASYEGITNYKVITDWIQLLFNYRMNGNEDLREIVKLTRLIDMLEDEGTEYSTEMLKLNTFEAFDYNVNTYYQPPAAGDIFIDTKGQYYILVGQDCDIMMSQSRVGNNAVTEFVKAETVPQDTIDKINYNLEYMYIDNFKQEGVEPLQRLKVKYSSRVFIDNAIIKLCCYNSEGKCQLNLNQELNEQVGDFIAPYLTEVFKELIAYFKAITLLNKSNSAEVSTIFNSKYSPRLIALNDYEIDASESTIKFGLQRVCRLNRSYVLYLYKLFLEYRGRHPFDCINLTRHSSLEAAVVGSENIQLPFDVILSSDRDTNRKSIKKLDWIVNPNEIESVIKKAYDKEVKLKDKTLININSNPFLISCEDGSQIELTKKDHTKILITFK